MRIHMTGSEWFESQTGGLNRYFGDLFTALRAVHPDTVTARAFGAPLPGGQSWGPVDASRRTRLATLAPRRLQPTLRELPRDAIVDRHFSLYGPGVGVGRRRPRSVVHFQGPWALESRSAGQGGGRVALKFAFERARLARPDRFVVLSQRFAQVLVESFGVDPQRVSVIAPGVDLARFTLAGPGTGADVLVVRRLEHRMGIDVLIDAWPSVLAEHPEARLRIVGTGTAEATLRERAAASPASASIVFEGAVSDARLAQLYADCACTVVPSVALEGFGLIALESMAVGRAPVVTDCGGLPDAVLGLDPSLVVPPRDAAALACRLDAALRGAVPGPEQCRAHAQSFAWDRVAERHLQLYQELV